MTTIVTANSGLQSFTFESTNVRIVNVDGDPWFVASDILAAMKSTTKLADASKTIEEDLGEGFVSNSPLKTSGGIQTFAILHEAAVTLLISRSRTEMGKAFNRHLHSVILPTIRKTGKFIAHPEFDLSILDREVDINQRYKASVLALREAKIQDNQRKLDRFRVKIKFVAPVEFNKSIVAWVDRYLAYCEGSILYIGIAGKKANTLSTSYAAFCIRNDFEILGQQRFSSELIKYLSHGKQWQINKQPRDSTGTCILNIAFA